MNRGGDGNEPEGRGRFACEAVAKKWRGDGREPREPAEIPGPGTGGSTRPGNRRKRQARESEGRRPAPGRDARSGPASEPPDPDTASERADTSRRRPAPPPPRPRGSCRILRRVQLASKQTLAIRPGGPTFPAPVLPRPAAAPLSPPPAHPAVTGPCAARPDWPAAAGRWSPPAGGAGWWRRGQVPGRAGLANCSPPTGALSDSSELCLVSCPSL